MVDNGFIMDKEDLHIGDIIRFHCWGNGGFLFGIIIEQEVKLFTGKLNIWRPLAMYALQQHGIDGITLIKDESNVNEYELHDLRDLIKEAQNRGVYYILR